MLLSRLSITFFCFISHIELHTCSASEDQLDDPYTFNGVPLTRPNADFSSGAPNRNGQKSLDDEEEELVRSAPSALDLMSQAEAYQSHDNDSDGRDAGNNQYDVIIVGAGWSGLAAALKLQASGITNIKILEGRDYIGGRSYTKTFNGEKLDMGSMWLEYGRCNPLFTLFKFAGADMKRYLDETLIYSPTGRPFPDVWVQKYFSNLYNGLWYYYYLSKIYLIADDEDEPYSIAYNETIANLQTVSYPAEKIYILAALVQTKLTIPYASDLEELGLKYGESGPAFCYENADFYASDRFVQSGFSEAVNVFAGPIQSKIDTNAAVKVIDYTSDNVIVNYEDRSSGTDETIFAKKVIVTVPLGVLKRNSENGGIDFRPPLSPYMQEGIDGIGIGRQIRLFMFWDEQDVFWPESPDVFLDSSTVVETDLQIKYYIASYLHETTKPYLTAIMRSAEVFEISRLYSNSNVTKYEEELMKIAMGPLRGLFGNSITDPKEYIANRWLHDEFAYGVYSANHINHLNPYRMRLREPIDDKIYLAGEATTVTRYGSVHGAYYSGLNASKTVRNSL